VDYHIVDLWYENAPENNGDDNVEAHRDFTSEHSWSLAVFGEMSQQRAQNRNSRHYKSPFTLKINRTSPISPRIQNCYKATWNEKDDSINK